MEDPTQICTQIINMFDANTKALIGAIAAIVLQFIVLARFYIEKRKNTETIVRSQADR